VFDSDVGEDELGEVGWVREVKVLVVDVREIVVAMVLEEDGVGGAGGRDGVEEIEPGCTTL
jgi:hypothetical protein